MKTKYSLGQLSIFIQELWNFWEGRQHLTCYKAKLYIQLKKNNSFSQ